MTLNLECLRKVLLALETTLTFEHAEGNDAPFAFSFPMLFIGDLYKIDGLNSFSPEEVFYAVYNLEQAGFIAANIDYANDSVDDCLITDITYEGHMFLKNIKSESVWGKVKASIAKVGGDISISVLSTLATYFVKQIIGLNP